MPVPPASDLVRADDRFTSKIIPRPGFGATLPIAASYTATVTATVTGSSATCYPNAKHPKHALPESALDVILDLILVMAAPTAVCLPKAVLRFRVVPALRGLSEVVHATTMVAPAVSPNARGMAGPNADSAARRRGAIT